MRKLNKILLLANVVLTSMIASCAKNTVEDSSAGCFSPVEIKAVCREDAKKTNVRIKNTSDKDYANVTIGADCKKVNYGTIRSGETSCYEIYDKIYRYASTTLQIDGKEYKLMPIDFVGETPLGLGKFTYAISIVNSQNNLDIKTTKDQSYLNADFANLMESCLIFEYDEIDTRSLEQGLLCKQFTPKNLTNMKWNEENNRLKRSFKFKDFIEAWAFMTKVAMIAEKMGHHPEWSNVYNTVDITLTTHDKENTVTEKDRALAKKIDALA